MSDTTREELHRRLAQTRRLASAAHDSLTRQRLHALIEELQQQLAAAATQNIDQPN